MRATHLFLPDREIKNIKAYVPQAKGFYEHMGFHIYKMEAVVSLRRFENMIKRFLKYVDGKKECYFCILNLNKLSEPVPAARRDCNIIHAQSLSKIGLFLAFQNNYFTAVELQHSFRAIGVVLIGQKHFFYRIFKFGGNGFTAEVGGNENAL